MPVEGIIVLAVYGLVIVGVLTVFIVSATADGREARRSASKRALEQRYAGPHPEITDRSLRRQIRASMRQIRFDDKFGFEASARTDRAVLARQIAEAKRRGLVFTR